MSSLTHTIQPEAEELLLKRSELAELEQVLAERELDLSTLKSKLHLFEKRYQQVVGAKYRELDEVRVQVMELAARFYPRSDDFQHSAKNAREQAKKSAGEGEGFGIDPKEDQRFQPSEELKKLFREVAKKIHPDLADDHQEQKRRHDLMSKLNLAYDLLDEEGIRAVLMEWEEGNPGKEDVSMGTQLVRLLRKISRGRKRLERITLEQEELEQSEMFVLMDKSEGLGENGLDLLQELAGKVEEKIVMVKSRIRDLASDIP